MTRRLRLFPPPARLLLAAALLLSAPAASRAEGPAELRSRLDAAYGRYMDAVANDADAVEIRAAYDEYVALHAKLGATAPEALPPGDPSPLSAEPSAVRPAAPSARIVDDGSASSTPAARAFPDFTARLSSTLYRQKNRVQSLVESLRAKLAGERDPAAAIRTRLELAYLEQEFCRDLPRAKELVDEACAIAAAPGIDPALRRKAEEARQAVAAKLHVNGLFDAITPLRAAANEANRRLEGKSFLKSPFGTIAAWVDKSIKSVKYRLAVSKMRETKFEYEKKGTFNLANTGLSFIVDGRRVDLDTTDVFEAFDLLAKHDVTDVQLLRENNEAWYARWHILNDARRSIDITYFIVDNDIFGRSMLGLLRKKAREGVKIRFMMDAHGTKSLSSLFGGLDYLQELAREPNVELRVYNPVKFAIPRAWHDIRTIVGSNHDKIIVVDGVWCVTGGRNIKAHYFTDHADHPESLRDTDVLFRSAALGERMKTAFDEEWDGLYNTRVRPDLLGNWSSKAEELEWARMAMDLHLRGKNPPAGEGYDEELAAELASNRRMRAYEEFRVFPEFCRVPVQILDKHSFNTERNDISDNIVRLMDGCSSEIVIQNPYIEITPVMHQAMKRANDRGVRIIVHTTSPVSSDSVMSQVFFSDEWKDYLAEMGNLEIHAFTGKKVLHAKVFVFDRNVAVIGTYNMDYMSEQINSELVAAILSPEFAARVRANIAEDIAESTQYTIRRDAGGKPVLDGKGRPVEEVGPRVLTPKGLMLKLDLLRKLKILRPLI